jgi:hypothetical protein
MAGIARFSDHFRPFPTRQLPFFWRGRQPNPVQSFAVACARPGAKISKTQSMDEKAIVCAPGGTSACDWNEFACDQA